MDWNKRKWSSIVKNKSFEKKMKEVTTFTEKEKMQKGRRCRNNFRKTKTIWKFDETFTSHIHYHSTIKKPIDSWNGKEIVTYRANGWFSTTVALDRLKIVSFTSKRTCHFSCSLPIFVSLETKSSHGSWTHTVDSPFSNKRMGKDLLLYFSQKCLSLCFLVCSILKTMDRFLFI